MVQILGRGGLEIWLSFFQENLWSPLINIKLDYLTTLTPRQFLGKYLPRASIFIVIFQLILYSRKDL